MNAQALEIYSYLMREEIQFIRYCHTGYRDDLEWENIMKKSKQEVTIPCVAVYHRKKDDIFFLYLHCKEKQLPVTLDGWQLLQSEKSNAEAALKRVTHILQCDLHTISPLGLLFDRTKQCLFAIDSAIETEKMLCLSPCSNQSSVLIKPEILLKKFQPIVERKILVK